MMRPVDEVLRDLKALGCNYNSRMVMKSHALGVDIAELHMSRKSDAKEFQTIEEVIQAHVTQTQEQQA